MTPIQSSGFYSKKGFIVLSITFILIVGFSIQLIIPHDGSVFIMQFLVLVLVYLTTRVRRTGLSEIGFTSPVNIKQTILYSLLYTVLIFFIFRIGLEPILENITGEERDLSRFDFLKHNFGAVGQTLVMIWISAAFFEEVFFRGYLIKYISLLFNKTQLGWVIGIIISSIFFAFVHQYQGISGILLTGLAAVFLGYVYYRHQDNLWIPIIAHGLTDTSAVLLYYFDVYEEVTRIIFS